MNASFDSALDILDKKTPGSPAQIRALREEVFAIRREVKAYLDRGLSSGEAPPARALLQAVEGAEEIISRLAA
jgi:hypothetical protein